MDLAGAFIFSLGALMLAILISLVFAINMVLTQAASYRLFYIYISLFALTMVMHILLWMYIVTDTPSGGVWPGIIAIDAVITIVNIFLLRRYYRKIVRQAVYKT